MNTSKEAYDNPVNKAKRQTHRSSILTFLMVNADNRYTAPEISKNIGINRIEVTRRMSEIEGVSIVATKKHGTQSYNVYQFTGDAPNKPSKMGWKAAYDKAIKSMKVELPAAQLVSIDFISQWIQDKAKDIKYGI